MQAAVQSAVAKFGKGAVQLSRVQLGSPGNGSVQGAVQGTIRSAKPMHCKGLSFLKLPR